MGGYVVSGRAASPLAAMTRKWNRARVWTLRVIGLAAIALAVGAFLWASLSWLTIAVVAIAAGCIATMVYLWWVTERAERTLADPGNARQSPKSKTGQP